MKKVFVFTVAMLVSSSIATASVPNRREIAIDCGDIRLSFVVADKTKDYKGNWIIRFDAFDRDEDVLTVKYGKQGSVWGNWIKEGDTIDWPEDWQDNKLSWTIRSGQNSVLQTLEGFAFNSGRAQTGLFTVRSTAKKGIGTTYQCLLKSNKWQPARQGTP
jgi:hypothetical protein